MEKFEYKKPEIHIHCLIIESKILSVTNPTGTETDEAFSSRFEGVIDDLEEGTTIQQEHTATEYYTK